MINNIFFLRISVVFFGLIMLIIFINGFLKKFIFRRNIINNSLISIESKISLGQNSAIYIVNIQEEVRLVLGVTANSITQLCTLKPITHKNNKNDVIN
ncbi:MAG: flagellar biosynthetic protein FliO [Buchnera aphidicola (Chaetogeoica yunlongensis)]